MNDELVNDPLFPSQRHLQNTGQSGGTPGVDLNVVKVWADYDGSGVVVGVVDAGVELPHPDQAANVDSSLGYDYFLPDNPGEPVNANENHGVAVAGLIAAVSGNGLGGTGAGDGDDGLVGDAGDNILYGGLGDDILDGGQDGLDAAYYVGRLAMYAASETDGVATITGPEGTDVLRNIDLIVFADDAVSLSSLLQTGAAALAA